MLVYIAGKRRQLGYNSLSSVASLILSAANILTEYLNYSIPQAWHDRIKAARVRLPLEEAIKAGIKTRLPNSEDLLSPNEPGNGGFLIGIKIEETGTPLIAATQR